MERFNEPIRIDNWSVCAPGVDAYTPPECITISLQGIIFDHPRDDLKKRIDPKKGKHVITSSIQEADKRLFNTYNTTYKLGRISPKYRKWLKENKPEWNWRKPITLIKKNNA